MQCPKCHSNNPDTLKFCGECGTQLDSSKGVRPEITETIQTPVRELTTGSTFASRYQVIEELGRGGMGRVYKVHDTKVGEKIALKLIRPEAGLDKTTIERFSNELRLARKIRHKNICQMFDLGEDEGTRYITMEYVRGEDLKQLVRKVGRLSPGQAVGIARQVCAGLEEAHKLGVVHRDLKPQNIMIDEDGSARIMDFGIARSLSGKGITGAGVMIGTPEYMSPEQVEGKETDPRSDIYSLGVILYEMATGHAPFEGDTPFTIGVKHKSEAPKDPRELNAQLPEDLSRLILRCLEKDKGARYQTAAEVGAELAKINQGIPTAERLVPRRKTPTSKRITVQFEPRKIAVPALIVIGVAVIAFFLWKFLPRKEVAPAPKIENSIAVISFENQTGDRAYDYLQEAIPNLLITGLEQAGGLYVVSWERLEDLLKQLGRANVSTIDKDLGFRLCRMEGVESIVLGSFVKAENTFVTDVKVLDVERKTLLKTATARGEGVASILNRQIDELCQSVAAGLGFVKQKADMEKLGVSGVTTGSMEAYRYYLQGMENWRKYFTPEAAKDLEKAVAIDPEFAIGYFWLSGLYSSLGRRNEARVAIQKAKQNASKATEKERLLIEAGYASNFESDFEKFYSILLDINKKFPKEKIVYTMLSSYYLRLGDVQKMLETCQKALALDPNYGEAHNMIAFVYVLKEDYDQAVRHLEKYVELNPREPNPYDSLADAYLLMGRLDEAMAAYAKAIALKSDFMPTYPKLAYAYALNEDYPKALEWIDKYLAGAPEPADEVACYRWRAFYSLWLGSEEACLGQIQKMTEVVAAQGMFGGEHHWILTNLYRVMNKLDLCRQANEAWYASVSKVVPQQASKSMRAAHGYFSGLIDVRERNIPSAKARLAEIRALIAGMALDLDRGMAQRCGDALEGEILFQEKEYDRAVALFEKTVPPSSAILSNTADVIDTNLFPRDLKARALEAKGDRDGAIAEYERLTSLNLKGADRRLIDPQHHYRLAKLYDSKGMKGKAVERYRKFLDLWKDADPGRPEVEDARKRLAALT